MARVGVEGTSSYGASLARHLRAAGVEVVEVDRPNRQERRRKGKTDTVDAIEAARAAQGQRQLGAAKTKDGNVEAIRALVVAKRSARDTKIKTFNQIRHLGFTAPEEIRQSLKGLSASDGRQEGGRHAAPSRTATRSPTPPRRRCAPSAAGSSRSTPSAKNWTGCSARFLAETAPGLLGLYGVGNDSAAALLVAAGDNPDRLRSEAAWARLCGVSPIEASSGKVVRHRLNPRRGPPSQRRLVAHRRHPHELRPAHHRLRRTAQQGRAHQKRGHPGPEALHRPPGVPLCDRRRLDIPRSYLSRGSVRFVGEEVGELFGEAVGGGRRRPVLTMT